MTDISTDKEGGAHHVNEAEVANISGGDLRESRRPLACLAAAHGLYRLDYAIGPAGGACACRHPGELQEYFHAPDDGSAFRSVLEEDPEADT